MHTAFSTIKWLPSSPRKVLIACTLLSFGMAVGALLLTDISHHTSDQTDKSYPMSDQPLSHQSIAPIAPFSTASAIT
jgi:hypothetical protein